SPATRRSSCSSHARLCASPAFPSQYKGWPSSGGAGSNDCVRPPSPAPERGTWERKATPPAGGGPGREKARRARNPARLWAGGMPIQERQVDPFAIAQEPVASTGPHVAQLVADPHAALRLARRALHRPRPATAEIGLGIGSEQHLASRRGRSLGAQGSPRLGARR